MISFGLTSFPAHLENLQPPREHFKVPCRILHQFLPIKYLCTFNYPINLLKVKECSTYLEFKPFIALSKVKSLQPVALFTN